jgi:hypothetical protein
VVRVNLTGAQHNTEFPSLVAQGYRLRRFFAYSTSGGTRYGSLWERAPGDWFHHYELTGTQYRSQHEVYLAQGFALHHLHVLGDRYSAIWLRP